MKLNGKNYTSTKPTTNNDCQRLHSGTTCQKQQHPSSETYQNIRRMIVKMALREKWRHCKVAYRLWNQMEPNQKHDIQKLKDDGRGELENLIKLEEERLKTTLERVQAHFLAELKMRTEELKGQLTQFPTGAVSQQALNSLALPFSDRMRRLREKLNNAVEFKQLLMNTQMELAKLCVLSPAEEAEAKHNFNLICDYQRRRDLNLRGKDLYTPAVGKHLVRRTFKKTAVDTYELLSGYRLPLPDPENSPELRIGCIGGGPGSDLVGALTHLVELGFTRFHCYILDFNSEMWREVGSPLASLFARECAKLNRKVEVKIEWEFLDMSQQEAGTAVAGRDFHLITCCWALNEDTFNAAVWETILKGKAILAVVDGDRFPIEFIAEKCGQRQHYYSGLETPRGLIVLH